MTVQVWPHLYLKTVGRIEPRIMNDRRSQNLTVR